MPALTFDDLMPEATPAAPAQGRAGSGALTFDDLVAPSNPGNGRGYLDTVADYGRAALSGLDAGVAAVAGLPGDVARGAIWLSDKERSIRTGRPYEEIRNERDASALVPSTAIDAATSAAAREGSPLRYDPQSAGSRAVETVTSFVPGALLTGGLGSARAAAAQIAAPAAGQLAARGANSVLGIDGTPGALLEGAGALAGGLGGAFAASRTTPANAILRDKVRGMDPAQLQAAQDLREFAATRGVDLPIDEAYAQVTGQTNNPLSNMRTVVERTPEGAAVFGPLMAARPEQVRRAAEAGLREVSPTLRAPGELGPVIQQEARAAFNATPEGRAMADAMKATGPRMSPGQAGDVIQPELRRVYDQRMLAREEGTRDLYRAAEEAPERIGVDRYIPAERAGEPIVTQPQGRAGFTNDAPRPLDRPTFNRIEGQSEGESLARFIARNGGIDLSGDARAADLQRFNIPGLGNVARQDGKSIDNFWREHLVANGYLKPDADGGAARDVTNEVLRLLQNEQRAGQAGARFPIYSERVAGRTAASQSDEYRNSLELWGGRLDEDLTKAGLDPKTVDPEVRSRTLGALMRGENGDPLDAFERTINGMREPPAPYVKSTTVEDQIYAPRFGQANPQGVIDFIDRQAESAKGPVRDALLEARKGLFNAQGETDLTIRGLNGARKAINAQVEGAPKEVQAALLGVRNRLDAELAVAPEYDRARSEFERLSRPLDAFASDRPVGRAVAQEPKTQRFEMPPEQVPSAFDSASASRDLVQNGTPNARRAYERHLTTQILDRVSDGRRTVNPDALYRAINENADTLANFPEVRQRLVNVAVARDGLQRAEQSTVLGRVSQDADVRVALRELFNPDPLPETAAEIGRTMGRIAQRNPRAAAELVRLHMEANLNTARHTLMSGDNAKAGAKLSVILQGNPQQRRNFEAVMKALPNGEQRLQGFDRLMEVLEATGKAPNPQSGTAFFTQAMKDASQQAGIVSKGALAVKTGGVAVVKQLNDFAERIALGRNMDQMARLLTRPDSGRLLVQLANTPSRVSRAQVLALRLSYMGRQGGNRED